MAEPVNPEVKLSAELVQNPSSAQTQDIPEGKLPELEFETKEHDFGIIKQGESVSYTFNFTNVGESGLVISQAKGSCGCTVPEWPKEEILPQEEGKIKVTFNSSGKSGIQTKTVTLVSNAIPNTTVLTIKAEIKE